MAQGRKNAGFGADILKIYDDFGKRLYEWTKVVDRNGGRLDPGRSNRDEWGD
jgi:hypothetical protein